MKLCLNMIVIGECQVEAADLHYVEARRTNLRCSSQMEGGSACKYLICLIALLDSLIEEYDRNNSMFCAGNFSPAAGCESS